MSNPIRKLYKSQHLPGWLQVFLAIAAILIAIPGTILAIQQLLTSPTPTPDLAPATPVEITIPSPGTNCLTTIRSTTPGSTTISELYSGPPGGSSNHLSRVLNVGQEVIVTGHYPEIESTDKKWYRIETPDRAYLGWIMEDFLAPISSNCPI